MIFKEVTNHSMFEGSYEGPWSEFDKDKHGWPDQLKNRLSEIGWTEIVLKASDKTFGQGITAESTVLNATYWQLRWNNCLKTTFWY